MALITEHAYDVAADRDDFCRHILGLVVPGRAPVRCGMPQSAHERVVEASKAATVSNAAPRQAPDEATTTRSDTVETFERIGIAVGVRDLTPSNAGYGVRLQLHESFVVLDPTEAANLAAMLQHAAQDAIHADRTARR